MKVYKIKVVVTKTVTFTEKEWKEEGGVGTLDDFSAGMYAKGCLIEDLENNPQRGSVQILFKDDTDEIR